MNCGRCTDIHSRRLGAASFQHTPDWKTKERSRPKIERSAVDYFPSSAKRQVSPRAPESPSPLLFCRTYLPHHFDVSFSDVRKQDARKLRGPVEDKECFAIADRREGGKTTRCRGFVLWGACYGRFLYCVYGATGGRCPTCFFAPPGSW